MASGGTFERVYRASRFLLVLEFIYLPMERTFALGGAIVFVSAPLVVLLDVQQLSWPEVLLTMAGAGVFAWWGGSTSYRQLADLFRGAKAFEGRVDDVVTTTERSGKGGSYPVLVFQVAGHSFRVSHPRQELSSAVLCGVRARVLEAPGTRTVREVWVLRD